MNDLGLVSVHRLRRQRSLTDSRRARGKDYPNLVRGLDITKPFQVITSDISYIRTAEGFEYLCKIKDVASGIVLAYTMADRMKTDLARNTVHLDHLIRLKPITQYGSLRSRDTVHADRPKRFIPIA